jgi:hypothetical protein
MSPTEDLQAVHARIQALEAELDAATEQLEAFGFRVVFEDPPPPPPPALPAPLPPSIFRGVSWTRKRMMWRAQMAESKAGPAKSIDYFVSEVDAAMAWDNEARIRGLFHKLNLPIP